MLITGHKCLTILLTWRTQFQTLLSIWLNLTLSILCYSSDTQKQFYHMLSAFGWRWQHQVVGKGELSEEGLEPEADSLHGWAYPVQCHLAVQAVKDGSNFIMADTLMQTLARFKYCCITGGQGQAFYTRWNDKVSTIRFCSTQTWYLLLVPHLWPMIRFLPLGKTQYPTCLWKNKICFINSLQSSLPTKAVVVRWPPKDQHWWGNALGGFQVRNPEDDSNCIAVV